MIECWRIPHSLILKMELIFFFLSSKLYPKQKNMLWWFLSDFFCCSALLLTFSFCYYFTICSYPWRYKRLPKMYTACCNTFQPEMQQNKNALLLQELFLPERSMQECSHEHCINPGKWGFKPEKASQKWRGTCSSSDGERPQAQTEHGKSPKHFWGMYMSQIAPGAAPLCHY